MYQINLPGDLAGMTVATKILAQFFFQGRSVLISLQGLCDRGLLLGRIVHLAVDFSIADCEHIQHDEIPTYRIPDTSDKMGLSRAIEYIWNPRYRPVQPAAGGPNAL